KKYLDYSKINLSVDNEMIHEDSLYGLKIYKLNQPLSPGESLRLDFSCHLERRNFDMTTQVVKNGSFVNNLYFTPAIGYDHNSEITGEKNRKRHNLPPRERMANIGDPIQSNNNYLTNNADWVLFEAVVSTSSDQIAVSCGDLVREWTENNRRYFHYRMDHEMMNFYSFLSAKYAIKKDVWSNSDESNVSLEIYYHPAHGYNIDKIMKSMKVSLDYFTKNFGSYPDKVLRIVEFPNYSSFAQSFPTTIPFSESIGFIADIKNKDDEIDYPFEITSHEISHQWWAHQVIGANVKGAVLMSETLAQYSSLMAMKHTYHEEAIEKYLKHEVNSYLKARSNETHMEQPLRLVENQGYIHYNKSSLVTYTFQYFVGEETFNRGLKRFLDQTKWRNPPYPDSDEFISAIRTEVPDSLQYLVTDIFEQITFYDNKINEASFVKNDNGKFEIKLNLSTSKRYADGLGKETEETSRNLIPIAVMTKREDGKNEKIFLENFWLDSGTTELNFAVNQEPAEIIIDPLNLLIDKNKKDDSFKF
ncbi:MAG: M1 family aminopeptidase, partial [Candidatus Cloacimonetes bacterium]|nr:M1 family aminopeptidase [Candidatus Cloacimonadota bacterium]